MSQFPALNSSIAMNNIAPYRLVIRRLHDSNISEYGICMEPLDSPETTYKFWENVIATRFDYEADKEALVSILLDTKLKPVCYHVISVGSLNETIAHPREIFRSAIMVGAYGLLICHNHPSGDPSPSQADHRLTRGLREAADLLQIRFFDHLIIGGTNGHQSYYSFRESGVL